MRSKTSTWFETSVKYQKTMDDGSEKETTEQYVVDALSFTEAESVIYDEMSVYTSGELKISRIAKAPYGEIFFSDMQDDDKWYKTKLQFIVPDEKTGKEKRSNQNYLVQANSLPRAVKYVDEVMGGTMLDYVIASIAETKIMDVFEHHASKAKKPEEKNDVPEYLEGEGKKAEETPAE